MSNLCQIYLQQLTNAKKKLAHLENELHDIRLKILRSNNNPEYFHELKKITLEMTLILNEIDQYQFNIDQCNKEKKESNFS